MRLYQALTLLIGVAVLALNVEARRVHDAFAPPVTPAVVRVGHPAVAAAPASAPPTTAIKQTVTIPVAAGKPSAQPAVAECCSCFCYVRLKLVKVTHWFKVVFGLVKDKNAHLVVMPIAKQEGYILEFAPVEEEDAPAPVVAVAAGGAAAAAAPVPVKIHTPVPPYRIWHDRTEHYQVEAEFKRFEHGQIWLHKPNGVTIHVPAERLAIPDLIYIERLLRQQHKSAVSAAFIHGQPFPYRFEHALSMLSPWESIAVIMVFCTGFVVMMRMFYVFTLLSFRSYRARQKGEYEFSGYGLVEELYVSPPEYLPTQVAIVPKVYNQV